MLDGLYNMGIWIWMYQGVFHRNENVQTIESNLSLFFEKLRIVGFQLIKNLEINLFSFVVD